jgi:Dockerin type I domain
MQRLFMWTVPLMVWLVITTFVAPGYASFHLMQIQGLIAGVDGNTDAQAIQLRMRAPGQNLLNTGAPNGPAKLVVRDATGSNPVTLITFASNVSIANAGSTVLITTADFANYTDPTLVSDFTMTQRIPDSYMAAGRLTYETSANAILWSLAWGGTSYTGTTNAITFNDDNGNAGKLAAGLSTSGTQGLFLTTAASALSTTNSADYALLTSSLSVTNNAGNAFDVVLPPIPGDVNRDGTVNLDDLNEVKNNFGNVGAPGIPGDDDGDGMVNLTDLNRVKNNFGNSGPGFSNLPEPATVMLSGATAVAMLGRRKRSRMI